MDWETAEEEQLFQDLDRSDQSRHFSSKGQNELQSEDEKSEVEKERKDLSVFQNILAKEDLDFSSQLNQIQDILAAGKAAARSSAAASSAAQEASIAAAAAAENAKAALEEVEKLVNILEGHKCHQQMSLKTTKMSSQKDINDFAHLGSRTKTSADESKDETEMATSSDPINFEQKVENSDVKDTVSVKEKVSQIARRPLSSSNFSPLSGIASMNTPIADSLITDLLNQVRQAG